MRGQQGLLKSGGLMREGGAWGIRRGLDHVFKLEYEKSMGGSRKEKGRGLGRRRCYAVVTRRAVHSH